MNGGNYKKGGKSFKFQWGKAKRGIIIFDLILLGGPCRKLCTNLGKLKVTLIIISHAWWKRGEALEIIGLDELSRLIE